MITATDVLAIIQAEHTTILEDYSWTRRKNDFVINLVAPYNTGTVTTVGTAVTGVSTAFASSMVGSFIRTSNDTFYRLVTAVGGASSLTIEIAEPTDLSAATTFTIFKNIYQLPSDFGRATSVMSDIRLTEWARTELDRLDPYRTTTGTRPDVYTIHGPNYPNPGATNNYQIEFWPVPSSAQTIRMEYLKTNTLVSASDTPLYRSDVLVWKAGESSCFFLFGKTGDQAWLALADRYHARYTEAMQGAREDDLGKYSAPQYIKDKAFTFGRGDDFYLSHDPMWLRR